MIMLSRSIHKSFIRKSIDNGFCYEHKLRQEPDCGKINYDCSQYNIGRE